MWGEVVKFSSQTSNELVLFVIYTSPLWGFNVLYGAFSNLLPQAFFLKSASKLEASHSILASNFESLSIYQYNHGLFK